MIGAVSERERKGLYKTGSSAFTTSKLRFWLAEGHIDSEKQMMDWEKKMTMQPTMVNMLRRSNNLSSYPLCNHQNGK